MKYQQKDKNLLNKLKTESLYETKEYRTAGNVCALITKDNKICVADTTYLVLTLLARK